MAREHRIIAAVGTTAVPVPPALGLCVDDSVNGAPFYVMGHVDGVVLDSQAARRRCRSSSDVRHASISSTCSPTSTTSTSTPSASATSPSAPDTSSVRCGAGRCSGRTRRPGNCRRSTRSAGDCAERMPEQHGVVIAHGDYRFGNCLTDTSAGRIAAVLDWELCTLGDPLADVGYLGVYWSDPGRPNGRSNDPTGLEGFLSYDELLERYARAHRARPLGHRLLRRLLVMAAGGDLRGGLLPLPARRDGRSADGRTGPRRPQDRDRGARRIGARRRCGGCRERGDDRRAGRLGTRLVHGRRHHPRHLPQGAADPVWSSSTRSRGSPRSSPGSPTRSSTPGSPS